MNRLGGRVTTLARSAAAGAVVAQVWQALGSFVLQVLAAHLLGASGLGIISLCLGVIIMVTAVGSGVVGDSLTVLDRSRRDLRAGLLVWTLVIAIGGSLGTAVVLALLGTLSWAFAGLFTMAAVFFLVEEVLRRVLMATMRFWRLVLVDTAALVTTITTLAVIGRHEPLTVGHFLAALALGQVIGCLVAVSQLPAGERWLPAPRGAAVREVVSFGGWRGVQVAVNPTAMTGLRFLVVAVLGAGALGGLEAGRIFAAPATLVVQGLGSYLLSSYVRDRKRPLTALRKRANRASLSLAGGSLLVGLVAAAVTPWLGHFVSGGSFVVAPTAVLAWSVYAAATATVQPFASLAAARGRQRGVLAIRISDSVSACVLIAVALWAGLPVATAPLGLALGLVVGGVLIRYFLLSDASDISNAVQVSVLDDADPVPPSAVGTPHEGPGDGSAVTLRARPGNAAPLGV